METTRDCWTDTNYRDVLYFVENHLWLFVQANATVHKPQNIVSNILQLDYNEMRLLQRIYFLLSEAVQRSVRESTPRLLRRLSQSTNQLMTESRGSVRGNVDWSLTFKRRLASGYNNPTTFLTRVTVKTYDLPEMQAVKFLLTLVNRLCVEVLGNIPGENEPSSYQPDGKWKDNLRSLYRLTVTFLNNSHLRNVSLPLKVTDMMIQRVRCARNAHFKSIYDSLRLHRKLFVQGDHDALRECITQGILKPLSRDTLYEIYVLFMTMTSIRQMGWSQEGLHLIGYGKGIIAEYSSKGKTLRIHYQTLPAEFTQSSLYTRLLRKYKIDVSLRRPDLVLELDSNKRDFTLLEIKRTQDKGYILDSAYKVLGYLKDFEKSFDTSCFPHAMVIVWEGVEDGADMDEVLVLLNQRNFRQFLESEFLTTSSFN